MGSPLSSHGSSEFAEDLRPSSPLPSDPGSDVEGEDTVMPSSKRQRTGQYTYRPIGDGANSDDEGSISSDSTSSIPGSFRDEEWNEPQITTCKWSQCPVGDTLNMDNLVRHIHQDHIGERKKRYACEWEGCARPGMVQASAYALRAHMRSHTREKPFFCALPECDKSFTRSDALAKHMRTVHETEALRPSDPVPKGLLKEVVVTAAQLEKHGQQQQQAPARPAGRLKLIMSKPREQQVKTDSGDGIESTVAFEGHGAVQQGDAVDNSKDNDHHHDHQINHHGADYEDLERHHHHHPHPPPRPEQVHRRPQSAAGEADSDATIYTSPSAPSSPASPPAPGSPLLHEHPIDHKVQSFLPIPYPPSLSFSLKEASLPPRTLYSLLRRQIHWAEQSNLALHESNSTLEELYKEEWKRKELALANYIEGELAGASVGDGVETKTLNTLVDETLPKDMLGWSGEVPWWREGGEVDEREEDGMEMSGVQG